VPRLLPLGPKPPTQFGPPPPEPPELEFTIEDWEKKAKEHMESAQASEQRLQELAVQYADLTPPPHPIKTLVQMLGIVTAGQAAQEAQQRQRLANQLKTEIANTELAVERDDFYARLYTQVPIVISSGGMTTAEEVLSILKPPENFTPEELDEVGDIIGSMVEALTGAPQLPELAAEAEPVELPGLVAPPTMIEAPPTTIHSLTVDAIVRSVTAPTAPPSVMSEEEWVQFMIDSGQISSKADLDTIEYLEDQAASIVDEWQERSNMLDTYRSGIAEMPDYKLVDVLKEMVVQPGLALMEIAGMYFEHVSAPLAGLIWKDVFRIRDIDVAYQNYKKTDSTWQALGHAWEEWDAPGEGAAEWILKYMLMEGLTDPLTYVGWGIATRITKPLGSVGRWVGWAERGIAEVFDLPFDMIKGIVRRLPKTVGQNATIAMTKSLQYVDKAMTQRFGKAVWQMTMREWDEGAEAFVKYALKNPQLDNVAARAGRELLKHVPVTEREVLSWATRLGTTLTPDQVTRQTVAAVDNIFEDFFSKVGGGRKLLTNKEAADELVRVLVGNFDDATSVVAGKLLLERSRGIINKALSFGQSKTTFSAMRQLGRSTRKLFIDAEDSVVALAMKEMGRTATLLTKIPIRVQRVWANGIDKWIVRPFAESYLTFALYGPMNVVEDVIRTTLGGVMPGGKSGANFARKWAGVSYDPALVSERSISETLGTIAAKESGEWNNWILQLGGLAKGFGDKTFDILVRKPGQIGMAMRTHFVDAKATQILKQIGGDQMERLARTGPDKLMGVTNKRIVKNVQQVAMELKMNGLPDAIRAATDDFTRAKIIRREVDDILLEHPDLPRPVRDFVMRQNDEGVLFQSVRKVPNWEGVTFTDIPTNLTRKIEAMVDNLPIDIKLRVKSISIDSTIIAPAVWHPDGSIVFRSIDDITPELLYHEIFHDIAFRVGDKTQFWADAARSIGWDETADEILAKGITGDIALLREHPMTGIVLSEAMADKFGDYALGKEVGTKWYNFFSKHFPKVSRPEDSINIVTREASSLLLDDFIASPERATAQYKQLADLLVQFDVRNPQEMAQLIQSLNLMSSTYGATPKQILGRAVERTRGLPFAERRVAMDKALDSITLFTERAGVDIDRVVQKIKLDIPNIYKGNQAYISSSENLFNLQTAKRLRAGELGEMTNAWRHDFFAAASPADLKSSSFWDDFSREINGRYHASNIEMADFDGMIKNAIDDLDIAGGLKARQRPAIKIVDRELAPNDVAQLIGARGDDISRGLMDVMTSQNDKDMFTSYVMAHVKPDDIGFSKESIGRVYDQIALSLQVDPKNMSWVAGKQMELEAVRRDLHSLYNSKLLPDDEIVAIRKYFNDTADAVDNVMYEVGDIPQGWEIMYRGSLKGEKGLAKGDFPGVFLSTSEAGAAQYGTARRYYIKPGQRILDLDDDVVGGLADEFARLNPAEASLMKLPDDLFLFPDKKWVRFLGDKGYTGTSVGADRFIFNPKDVRVRPPKAPVKRLKPEFTNYNDLRQQAMDEAHKWYYKEFTDYTNANAFDATMKSIYPFWTYESQRWFWLPRSFIRHPGTFTAFERWQDNTDYGYVHIPGTSVDINPFRGTIYGTMSTRLARRDYPEYYDSLGAAGDVIEFSDFLSRYGFYPGAHIGVPLTILGGVEMQFGEAMPSIIKTPLDVLIATFPDNESVRWISDHLFGDRFRDYLTILQINRRGGDGSLIFSKTKEGVALTEEEEQLVADARREVGWYSAGFEQFAMFRMRTDEQYQMYEEASKVIEEMTGFTPDQQEWLRQHGHRLWDMVGGMSPSEQAILQEMDYYKWVGQIRPLLPGKQQEILNKIEVAWNQVEKYGDQVQTTKLQLQREFLSGQRGPDDYLSQLLDTYNKQGEFIDNKIEEYPLMDLDNRAEYYKKYGQPQPVLHPMRELINLYFSIELLEITDPETGEKHRDWDNFWAQRQAIEDAIPDEFRSEWDDFISRNSTRLEQIRRDVSSTYFRTYNKIWEKILSTYSDEEQALVNEYLYLERTGQQLDRQAQIKATISAKTNNMLISSFRSEVSDAKQALRYANPHLDAWLFYWGRVSTFVTPQAEETYKQIAADTGRQI